jgi:hypothetical protein
MIVCQLPRVVQHHSLLLPQCGVLLDQQSWLHLAASLPVANTDAAALAVESLINSGSIGGGSGVTGYVDAASQSSAAAQQAGALVGLRALAEQQEGQLLTPHEALMW